MGGEGECNTLNSYGISEFTLPFPSLFFPWLNQVRNHSATKLSSFYNHNTVHLFYIFFLVPKPCLQTRPRRSKCWVFLFFFSFPPKDVYKVGDIYTHSVKNWSEFTNGSITGNHSQAGLLYRGVKAATVRQKSSQPVANVLGIHGMCWTAWNAELGTVQHRATSTETGSSDCKERLVSIFPPLH